MVSDTFLPRMGGIETQVANISERLALAGHDVTVLTATGAPEGSDPDANLPYRVIRRRWGVLPDIPLDPRAPAVFGDWIAHHRPDIVHLHMGEVTPVVQSMLGELAAGDVPALVTVHSIWSGATTIPVYRAAAAVGLGFPARIAWSAVSELVAGRIRRVLGQEVPIHLVPNGVDAAAWLHPVVPHDGVQAVTATRFAPRKRVGELLRILEDVDRALPGGARGAGLRVVLAGEGPGLAADRSWAERHGLLGWISLPGRLTRTELVDLYARSDVYLAPSVKEAASIAGREARCAGLAVLTRSQSGLAEAVEDGVEGALADTDADFASVLGRWVVGAGAGRGVGGPGSLAAIQAHNRSVPADCDWSVVLPATLRVYRTVIEDRATGR